MELASSIDFGMGYVVQRLRIRDGVRDITYDVERKDDQLSCWEA